MLSLFTSGLRPVDFWGNCYMSNTTDVELAIVDPHKVLLTFCLLCLFDFAIYEITHLLDNNFCYTSQLKYIFQLEENASHAVG